MKEFICIECPKGCRLTIDENLNVTGNTCLRGKQYAINEVTCPKRIVTSTVVLPAPTAVIKPLSSTATSVITPSTCVTVTSTYVPSPVFSESKSFISTAGECCHILYS